MSALEQDLTEYLAGPDPDYDTDPEPPQDADEANKRLRRLARIRAEIEAVEDQARTQIEQINAWAERRYEVLHNRARWEREGLEMWHRAVLADDPSRKTISLPCGTLKARAQQPVWEFDEPTFLAWAVEHAPDLVRIPVPKPAIEKVAVKKALVAVDPLGEGCGVHVVTAAGEVVPGVTVTVREPSFTVSTEVDG